jgi:hypothetical protein
MSMLGARAHETRCYLEIVDALRRWGAIPHDDMHALFRRIIFSILISNTDDHLRNHGFLLDSPDGWRLAPAYDLNPVPLDVKPRVLSTEIDIGAATASLEAHDHLKAIFAINDPSALGAYSAIKDAGKTDQVVIIGFDGEKNGKQAILEGKILCDPIQFPDEIARKTIAEMMKYFNGDEVEKEILIPSKLYYKKDAQSDPVLKQ